MRTVTDTTYNNIKTTMRRIQLLMYYFDLLLNRIIYAVEDRNIQISARKTLIYNSGATSVMVISSDITL